MLDFKYIRDNLEAVKANIANRFMDANPDLVVDLYKEYNLALGKVEELRTKRNENASKMKGKLDPIPKGSFNRRRENPKKSNC
jgi:seryl-tRNA synthetase